MSERRIRTGWGLDWDWPPVGASSPPSSVPRVKLTGRKVETVRATVCEVPPEAGSALTPVFAIGAPVPVRDRSATVMRVIAGCGAASGVGGQASPGVPLGIAPAGDPLEGGGAGGRPAAGGRVFGVVATRVGAAGVAAAC